METCGDPSFGTLEVSGPQRQGLRGAKRCASGEPREAGRDTHRGAETNDRDKSWEERDQREVRRGAKPGFGNQHAFQVPRNILLLRDTPVKQPWVLRDQPDAGRSGSLGRAGGTPALGHGARELRGREGGWGGARRRSGEGSPDAEGELEIAGTLVAVLWRLWAWEECIPGLEEWATGGMG